MEIIITGFKKLNYNTIQIITKKLDHRIFDTLKHVLSLHFDYELIEYNKNIEVNFDLNNDQINFEITLLMFMIELSDHLLDFDLAFYNVDGKQLNTLFNSADLEVEIDFVIEEIKISDANNISTFQVSIK